MSRTSYLKYCRIAYFSGPAGERKLYRQMAKRKPTRILEIGLDLGIRTLRMFDVAKRYCEADQIIYTGIDPFESRSKTLPPLAMKDAYKLLRQQGVKVKLVPGDTLCAMTRTANSLANTDLILIDATVSDSDLEQAWKYFPRMMHENSLILRQRATDRGKFLDVLSAADIQERIDREAGKVSRAA